ncbi:MAG: transcription-repair coupling factor [Alphaproteobacteria bacterium]|nr:transcription-repair coupling factor [Alphaproteobacteria bacterium]
MKILKAEPGRRTVHGVPEGFDALFLAQEVEASGGTILHVARDDARLSRLVEQLAFFAPKLKVIQIPAWDCLPYDRVSPNPEVASRRLDGLVRAAFLKAGPAIVVTTASSLVQRVPPKQSLKSTAFNLSAGAEQPVDNLVQFFVENGYHRTDTVREAGEYAVRGGIVDVFPAGAADPYRIDYFGDEIEGIRRFDPLTQRTAGKAKKIVFKPFSEVMLKEDTIQRFRSQYRQLFGAETMEDPLYQAVTAGQRHMGMEHWLPLFYDHVETLFDYLPNALLTLDDQTEDAIGARLDMVQEYFEARDGMLRAGAKEEGGGYKPLKPETLYLADGALDRYLADRAVHVFSGFAAPDHGTVLDGGARRGRDFADLRAKSDTAALDGVADHVKALRSAGRRVVFAGFSEGARTRFDSVIEEHGVERVAVVDGWADTKALEAGIAASVVLPVERGFEAGDLVFISEQDVFGDRLSRPAKRKRKADAFISEVSALHEGDLVVHVEHGIGRYDGLITLEVQGAPHDCLRIVYAGNDKLFVPVENLETLSKYGSEDAGVQLDKLGGAGWQARKARVKKRIREMADQLIKIAAERQLKTGTAIETPEGVYDEFAARFPYHETEDQMKAIEETLDDLASGRTMDRLVCGDVGFGKTEVALRAAFIAAMSGHQVAVVVPTTLLARQHHNGFRARFRGLPLRIAQLSRMVTAKDQKAIKEDLAEGKVDIVIGTHALLAKTIKFHDLGLLIVDEEQHFGVGQKERLKQLRANVHVLTLTATPIPRTLQMALTGIRDLSLIATAPVDRLAVRTFIMPYDGVVIREALMREKYRGGQSFYVCPRLVDIPRVAERLEKIVPELKFAVAHGQLPATELERVMSEFSDGRYDVLLSTNIVESGIDIPTANTLVVHRSDMFGLAQLYQLRGRVGRSKVRAYAYLTLPPGKKVTPGAQKRLEVMQNLDSLGAGFSLASHDLDIRGAGNLLGEEQSGHVKEVGVELYQHMLEEAVNELKSETPLEVQETWTPNIQIGVPVLIPEAYVQDLTVRLSLYRRVSELVDRTEIDQFAAEMIDRFGPLPAEVENLLQVISIKRLCKKAGIEKVDAGPKGGVIHLRNNSFADPDALIRYIAKQGPTLHVRPDQSLLVKRAWGDTTKRISGLNKLLGDLVKLAEKQTEPA